MGHVMNVTIIGQSDCTIKAWNVVQYKIKLQNTTFIIPILKINKLENYTQCSLSTGIDALNAEITEQKTETTEQKTETTEQNAQITDPQ